MANEQLGIEARSSLELDARVERVFRFASAEASTAPVSGKQPQPPRRPPRRYALGGNKYVEVLDYHTWELTEALPVDLALKVEYEMLDFGEMLAGESIYVPNGRTASGMFNPFAYRGHLRQIEKPGTYRFRVHLTPSRDVALSHADSRAYWDGYILVSPEMTLRVVEVPPPSKKAKK